MRRYIEHIKTKEPHERRKHAMQLSGAIVGLFFVAWVATFGARLATPAPQDGNGPSGDSGQTAAAANFNQAAGTDASGGAQLEVSTTSVYSY